MAKHIVAKVSEIPPGARKVLEVEGRSIGVFNVGGEYFALKNNCPHQGAKLCEGALVSCVTSDAPGSYEISRQGEILRCPWHGWEFDVRTGQSWFDPAKVRVKSYDVTVVTGSAMTPQIAGWLPGPYVAETYPVSTEDEFLLVEI